MRSPTWRLPSPLSKALSLAPAFALADLARHPGKRRRLPDARTGRSSPPPTTTAGVNGGIANGMPIVFRTAVKPTPASTTDQDTVDYTARADAELKIKGRHDPCIVPRAAVVQNSLAAFGILDLLSVRYGTLAQKHGLPRPVAE
ncbi:MAG: chorismate synthase [Subdoligranulum sp.]